MKKNFPGYYRPTEKEFAELWANCVFTLDANVLLDVYRYTPQTRKALLAILNQISGRLWIPHQAAIEYQKKRINVIVKQSEAYDDIQRLLQKSLSALEGQFGAYRRHPFLDVSRLLKRISRLFDQIYKELQQRRQEHPDWLSDDTIHNELADLLAGKIGAPYSEAQLEELYKLGEQRYGNKIPPGYADATEKPGNEKYGDLILWLQMIDYTKETQKPLIFVTGEHKEDWWQVMKGRTIGLQPQLIEEMYSKTNQPFYMYQTDRFVELAQQYLKSQVEQKVVEEIRDVRLSSEAARRLADQIESTRRYLADAAQPAEAKRRLLMEQLAQSSEATRRLLVEQLAQSSEATRRLLMEQLAQPSEAERSFAVQMAQLAQPSEAERSFAARMAQLAQPSEAEREAERSFAVQMAQLAQPPEAVRRMIEQSAQLAQSSEAVRRMIEQSAQLAQPSEAMRRLVEESSRTAEATRRFWEQMAQLVQPSEATRRMTEQKGKPSDQLNRIQAEPNTAHDNDQEQKKLSDSELPEKPDKPN